jgi:hypothetical protein
MLIKPCRKSTLFTDLRTPDPRHTGTAAALVTLKHGLKLCDFVYIHAAYLQINIISSDLHTARPLRRRGLDGNMSRSQIGTDG